MLVVIDKLPDPSNVPLPVTEPVKAIFLAVASFAAAAAVAVFAKYPLATSALLAYGVRSILVVPIFSNLDVLGIQIYSLYTSSPEPSLALIRYIVPFTPVDGNWLTTLISKLVILPTASFT